MNGDLDALAARYRAEGTIGDLPGGHFIDGDTVASHSGDEGSNAMRTDMDLKSVAARIAQA